MLRLKVCAGLYVLCSVIILVGFLLLNTKLYTVYGKTAFLFGLVLHILVNFYNVIVGDNPNRGLMSKKLRIFEVVAVVVRTSGFILSCIHYMFTRRILWVGIVGSLLMMVGGAMNFLKELRLERLEEENESS